MSSPEPVPKSKQLTRNILRKPLLSGAFTTGVLVLVTSSVSAADTNATVFELPKGCSNAETREEPPTTGRGLVAGSSGCQGNVIFSRAVPFADNVEPCDYDMTCSAAAQACDLEQCLRSVGSTHQITLSVQP